MMRIDTSPGAAGPFAPPVDWQGELDGYVVMMRQRFARDPIARQQIGVVARRADLVHFVGPWAEQARIIAEAVSTMGAGT